MQELDCANCAAKMEDKIKKISGVISVKMSFISQRLTIECEDGKMEEILDEAEKICKKIEPDCKIIRG